MADNEIHRTGSNIICWGCSNDIVLDGNRCSEGAGIHVWSVRLAASQKV
jgi:hypothetical protein